VLWLVPPTNGGIALWPTTRVVKFKYDVSQKQNGFNNKKKCYNHWIVSLLLYLNSQVGFNGLKYLYSVISVIDNLLPGNTEKERIALFVDSQSAISVMTHVEYVLPQLTSGLLFPLTRVRWLIRVTIRIYATPQVYTVTMRHDSCRKHSPTDFSW